MMIFFTFEISCRLRMPFGGSSGGTRSADLSLSWTGNVVGSGSHNRKIILFTLCVNSFSFENTCVQRWGNVPELREDLGWKVGLTRVSLEVLRRGEGACRPPDFLSRSSSPATLSSELVRTLGCAETHNVQQCIYNRRCDSHFVFWGRMH